jgi:hypothetical protein
MKNNSKNGNIEKELKDVFTAILSSGKKERETLYLELIDNQVVREAAILANKEDISGFNYKILNPFMKFIDGLIEYEVSPKSEVAFILKNADYIKNHFVMLFNRIEGPACSVDKARTVRSALLNFYLTDEEIKFNYEQKYTFHLPKYIFTEHKSIIDFFQAIESLSVGYFDNYVIELGKILEIEKEIKTGKEKYAGLVKNAVTSAENTVIGDDDKAFISLVNKLNINKIIHKIELYAKYFKINNYENKKDEDIVLEIIILLLNKFIRLLNDNQIFIKVIKFRIWIDMAYYRPPKDFTTTLIQYGVYFDFFRNDMGFAQKEITLCKEVYQPWAVKKENEYMKKINRHPLIEA